MPVFPPGKDLTPPQLAGTLAPVQPSQTLVCDQDSRPHEAGLPKVALVLIYAGEQDERIQNARPVADRVLEDLRPYLPGWREAERRGCRGGWKRVRRPAVAGRGGVAAVKWRMRP